MHANHSKLLVQSQDTIRLTSRNDGYTITVYKELLCFYCPYYRAALKGEFLEAKKNELEIDAVEIFIGWLCTGTINTDIHQCEDIVLVYLLADRIECLALRRAAISKLQALHRGNSGEPFLLPWAIIGLVYEKSALDSSPVRRYIRDFYSEHYRENLSCAKEKDCYNEAGLEFFFEVMVRQSAILLSGRSMKKKCECCNNACKYHEHKSEEERQQSKLFEPWDTPISLCYISLPACGLLR